MTTIPFTGLVNKRTCFKLSKLIVSLNYYSCFTDKTFIIAKRTTHLSRDSKQPPHIRGKLRLYSMEYCPFSHRVRLVLRAKGIDHEIVNINILNKPRWYTKIHADGKIPVLDIGRKFIKESIDICNYLEKEYCDSPLYPIDTAAAKEEMELVGKIGPISETFMTIMWQEEKKTASEWKKILLPHLEVFEEELLCRDTKYFSGDSPGMVDYLLWPLAERYKSIAMTLKENFSFGPCELQRLRKWRMVMRNHPVVDGIYNGSEKFYKAMLMNLGILPGDFDTI